MSNDEDHSAANTGANGTVVRAQFSLKSPEIPHDNLPALDYFLGAITPRADYPSTAHAELVERTSGLILAVAKERKCLASDLSVVMDLHIGSNGTASYKIHIL